MYLKFDAVKSDLQARVVIFGESAGLVESAGVEECRGVRGDLDRAPEDAASLPEAACLVA